MDAQNPKPSRLAAGLGARARASLARVTVPAVVSLSLMVPIAVAEEAPPPVIGADTQTFTLDNGLEVVVIPDHRAPVVTHMIWYKVGSADEPEGQSGIAHFLEHLMFKGTSTHPEGEFSKVISEIGGEENAFTSYDYTAYFQRVAKEHLTTMMAYEADRMQNLVLTDENVVPERQVVLEERNMRVEGEPGAVLGNAMDAVMFLRHPYGIPIIGWRDEIERLDREAALAFYDRFYTPNNAVLVVAGDVTAEEVLAAAKETYGKVPRRAEPPARERLEAQEIDVPRTVEHSDPKVNQESVRISWLAPSYRLADDGQAEALDVLAEALGGGNQSLLYRDLVMDKRVASSVGLFYRSGSYDMGQLIAYAVPSEGVSLETMRSELLAAIDRAVEEGLSEEEIARAKARLEADTIYAQDSQTAMARIFGSALMTGGTVEEVQNWPARIRAVTLDEVKAMAAELEPLTSTTGYLRKPTDQRS